MMEKFEKLLSGILVFMYMVAGAFFLIITHPIAGKAWICILALATIIRTARDLKKKKNDKVVNIEEWKK